VQKSILPFRTTQGVKWDIGKNIVKKLNIKRFAALFYKINPINKN